MAFKTSVNRKTCTGSAGKEVERWKVDIAGVGRRPNFDKSCQVADQRTSFGELTPQEMIFWHRTVRRHGKLVSVFLKLLALDFCL